MVQDFLWFANKVTNDLHFPLSFYKQEQVERRTNSYMERKGFSSYASFFQHISYDRDAFVRYCEHVTINVSEFFRNPAHWELLKEKILPKLLRYGNRSLKIWSVACSAGEEPYSLAMLMAKHFPFQSHHVLATDIDRTILEKAKSALYDRRQFVTCPTEYTAYFDHQGDETFLLSPSITKNVSFRQVDLLTSPFESNYDLVVCRNVSIYFTDEGKRKLYQKLSASLNKGGVLFVGATEQIYAPDQFNLKPIFPFFYEKN